MIDIIQPIVEMKTRRIKQWPVHTNRASNLGHPCERFLVYERTRWREKALHDVTLQFIFDEGNIHEAAVIRELQEAGFQIIEQQRAFEWKKYEITGHVDAKIKYDGGFIPIEIKSMSDWAWKSVNDLSDMHKSKSVYMRQYPAQMTLYLLMDEKEEGAFILKNKTTGLLKQIPVRLDYEYGETLIQKAERINTHVKAGTLPDRVDLSAGACEWCAYAQICLPERRHEGLIINDPELEGKLDRRAALKALKDEYDELDKEIREAVKERPETVVGNWLLKGKWVDKKAYTVEACRYWQTTIKRI